MRAIDVAIEAAGGLRQLAAGLGVSYQAVQKWRDGSVPPGRAASIEAFVKDARVTRRALCPDFPWDASQEAIALGATEQVGSA